jgi:hypothetical protein
MGIDIANFKKAYNEMIATTDISYNDSWGFLDSPRFKDYSEDEINRIINGGSTAERKKLSRNYFYKDGFYRRIIMYYVTILKYIGILIPNVENSSVDVPYIKKNYNKALDYIDKMNLKTFLANCTFRVLVDGCYYGIISKYDKTTFSVLDLPADYCRTRFKDGNGNDLIEFDLNYFDKIVDKDTRKEVFSIFPSTVVASYLAFESGKITDSWITIPSELGVCFPFIDTIPFFLNIIPSTIAYDKSVAIERDRQLEEIRKIIVQKIPHNNENDFLLDPEEVTTLHNGTVKMMKNNRHVSILTTYADVDAITSKFSSDNDSNNLDKMAQNIFTESGTSSQLFNSQNNLALTVSLKNDLSLMMFLGNKYSVFITNLINRLFSNSNINFKYEILPISIYNSEEYITSSLKLATSGYSFLLPGLALGLSQRDLGNLKDLENTVLKLSEKLIPLQTSYTQPSTSVVPETPGAPKKPPEETSDKTEKNKESLGKQGGSNNG